MRKPLPQDALFDWAQMTTALAEQEPWWEPGTKHGYHAFTFGFLVGEVVRRVSGRSLGTYFREEIAEPLGLDFHIGLPVEHDGRVADLIPQPERDVDPDSVPPLFAQLMKDMTDPSTLTGAAFTNPVLLDGLANTRAWRAAELPAVNGHGTARALARVYGALARGGEIDGVRVLRPESIELALTEQAFGPDAVLRIPMRFGLGFMLRQDLMPFAPSSRAFGHAGAGGSMGFADPDAKIGFGYTMNQMQMGLLGGAGSYSMTGALFASL